MSQQNTDKKKELEQIEDKATALVTLMYELQSNQIIANRFFMDLKKHQPLKKTTVPKTKTKTKTKQINDYNSARRKILADPKNSHLIIEEYEKYIQLKQSQLKEIKQEHSKIMDVTKSEYLKLIQLRGEVFPWFVADDLKILSDYYKNLSKLNIERNPKKCTKQLNGLLGKIESILTDNGVIIENLDLYQKDIKQGSILDLLITLRKHILSFRSDLLKLNNLSTDEAILKETNKKFSELIQLLLSIIKGNQIQQDLNKQEEENKDPELKKTVKPDNYDDARSQILTDPKNSHLIIEYYRDLMTEKEFQTKKIEDEQSKLIYSTSLLYLKLITIRNKVFPCFTSNDLKFFDKVGKFLLEFPKYMLEEGEQQSSILIEMLEVFYRKIKLIIESNGTTIEALNNIGLKDLTQYSNPHPLLEMLGKIRSLHKSVSELFKEKKQRKSLLDKYTEEISTLDTIFHEKPSEGTGLNLDNLLLKIKMDLLKLAGSIISKIIFEQNLILNLFNNITATKDSILKDQPEDYNNAVKQIFENPTNSDTIITNYIQETLKQYKSTKATQQILNLIQIRNNMLPQFNDSDFVIFEEAKKELLKLEIMDRSEDNLQEKLLILTTRLTKLKQQVEDMILKKGLNIEQLKISPAIQDLIPMETLPVHPLIEMLSTIDVLQKSTAKLTQSMKVPTDVNYPSSSRRYNR